MEEERLVFSTVFIDKLPDLVRESGNTDIGQVESSEDFLLGSFDPTSIGHHSNTPTMVEHLPLQCYGFATPFNAEAEALFLRD